MPVPDIGTLSMTREYTPQLFGILNESVPGVPKAGMAEYSRVPGVPKAEMIEYS